MKVIIKSGGYGMHTSGGVKLMLRGAEIDLPDDEARSLIETGAAERSGQDAEPVITAEAEAERDEACIDPSEYAPVLEDEGEANLPTFPEYKEDDLMLKTNKELESIISGLGLELPKKTNKAVLVKLIMDYFSIDGEEPPELGAEVPEV